MSAEDVLAISAPVLALAQLTKWLIQRGNGKIPWLGPISIFFYAALAEGLWVYSNIGFPPRALAFAIFANWVQIVLTAAGVYGFTRNMDTKVDTRPEPTDTGGPLNLTHA